MIAYFPDSYSDELWYSVCARFSDRMKFGTETGAMQALYGSRYAVATAGLPHRLGSLVSQFPTGHQCTVDRIIDHLSFLPYYGPFLRTSTYKDVRNLMADGSDSSLLLRIGACTNRVRPPKFFRTCPVCDVENRQKYCETYWRRLFQLPGVEVCPRHAIFLGVSDIRLDPLPTRHKYFSAESAQLAGVTHQINSKDSAHQSLLNIARNVEWLLQQERLNPGLDFLHQRYLEILTDRGFITRGGSVRMDDLRRSVIVRYGPRLLDLLQSGFQDEGGDGWLGNLLRKKSSSVAPLRHLILLRALDVDLKQFFFPTQSVQSAESPAACGPWPCLNPVCEHFQRPVIHDHVIEFIAKRKRHVALLACAVCGYTYALYDWNKPSNKADFVRDYGPVWLARLKKLWVDPDISVREIGAQLAVDPKTVKQHALDAGLSFPRKGKRWARAADLYKRRPAIRKSVGSQRVAWVALRQKNQPGGLKDLRKLRPDLFAWLYRNDREWLSRNLPPHIQVGIRRPQVDWAKRDEELAGQIATTAARIRNHLGKQQRITVTAIGRALGKQSLFEASVAKLPLTRSVLSSLLESGEDFAVRRVHAAAARLRETDGTFQRWKLVQAAGLRPQLECLPRVKDALDYEIRPFVKVSLSQQASITLRRL